MARSQSARLDRKKFFADPIMVGAIAFLIIFLTLFILYPLAMLLADSVTASERMNGVNAYYTENVEKRVDEYNYGRYNVFELEQKKDALKTVYDDALAAARLTSEKPREEPEVIAAKEAYNLANTEYKNANAAYRKAKTGAESASRGSILEFAVQMFKTCPRAKPGST